MTSTQISEIKSSDALSKISLGGSGGMALTNMDSVSALAQFISKMGDAVPSHLQGNPGACAGVIMQAVHWEMDPIVVANKSYSVNNRISFEAQLIHAVILRRAPIKGRIKHEYEGEGDDLTCRVWAKVEDDGEIEIVELTSPKLSEVRREKGKGSPLWHTKPRIQLFYNTIRDWCRIHFPDVILGVYSDDEMADAEGMKDITPKIQPEEGAVNPRVAELKKQQLQEGAIDPEPVAEDEVEPKDVTPPAEEIQEEDIEPDPVEDVEVPDESAEPDPGDEPVEPDPVEEETEEELAPTAENTAEPDTQSQMYQDGWSAAEFFGDDHVPPEFGNSTDQMNYYAGHAAYMETAQ